MTMDSNQVQQEIEITLNKLIDQHRALLASANNFSAESMQEFISEIKTLYAKALDLQHQHAIQSMEDLEAAIAVKNASIPPPAKTQPVHIESLIPTSSVAPAEVNEVRQVEVVPVIEQIAAQKPASTHPTMDELLVAAANKAAESKQAQESFRRKKVITDIHDKYDEVPTMAGKFSDQETLAKRMAGSKMQTGLAEKHQRKPIIDLKIAIGINEKFLFINQLFAGDAQGYHSSIEILNNSGSMEGARNYIHQNLLSKYDWDLSTHPASLFMDLVERRYIS